MNAVPAVHVIPKRKPKKDWRLLLILLPLLAIIIMFNYVPLAGWALSLVNYKPGLPLDKCQFMGLFFFQKLLKSRDTMRVLRNTVIFSALNLLTLPLPMILAILLNEIESNRFRKVAQVVTTLPHFISWVIVYALSFALFSSEGLLNQLRAGLSLRPQGILTDKNAVYWFQTAVSLWKSLGWNSIIYIAAVAGIDQELYEAARVDGAGRFRCALHVTLPGLLPTFIVLLLLQISNFISSGIDQYMVFTNNMVTKNIEVLDLYVYTTGLKNQNYSLAIAAGIMKSFISIALLIFANLTAKKVRGESIL